MLRAEYEEEMKGKRYGNEEVETGLGLNYALSYCISGLKYKHSILYK